MPSWNRADNQHVTRRALRLMLLRQLVRNGAIVAGFILVALGIGATGYHVLDGLGWMRC